MHVTETGPALRHLGQSFPFQQTISTQATSYLCAVRHATQRSAPGANTRAPTLPPHVITDWEYGGIEYGGLPVKTTVYCNGEPQPYCLVRQRLSAHRDVDLLQVQHNPQGCIYAAHLFEAEITHAVAESTGIDRRSLFSQHPRDAAGDLDLGPKACGPG